MLSLIWATASAGPDKSQSPPSSPPIHATVAKLPGRSDEGLCKHVYRIPASLCSGLSQDEDDKPHPARSGPGQG
ncbi:MAG: hypothetical protein NBV68_00050 [Erythrobacter sp.]|uniref:hypothetical protein n=1 Tax=Erythrobacter sp. TaxID=1042 RepID=UPI0025DE8AD2|nr:hypothetical protein [Erythrobacter sp.]MCL9997747.1 hypothetical protein [Erythrobacter sp.]